MAATHSVSGNNADALKVPAKATSQPKLETRPSTNIMKIESNSGSDSSSGTRRPRRPKKWGQAARARATKVRVKLPSIESYQKELEFPAEASGRVIVRLERLMGTDKIRITDSKYMSTLLERLEEEENEAWLKRTRERKLAERNRFRQLAVDGFMEPTTDMQDLLNHPVFRVNRILGRLNKIGNQYDLTPAKKLPPITPVEPFVGLTGPVQYGFNHQYSSKDYPTYDDEDLEEECDEDEDSKQEKDETEADETSEMTSTNAELAGEDGGLDLFLEQPEISLDDEEWEGEGFGGRLRGIDSLTATKLKYGVPLSENVEAKCKPYRSKLVEMVFADKLGSVSEMYETANEILGAYEREQLTADDFIIQLNRML